MIRNKENIPIDLLSIELLRHRKYCPALDQGYLSNIFKLENTLNPTVSTLVNYF